MNDIPTVESILNDEDVSSLSEDDVSVYQSKVKIEIIKLSHILIIYHIISISI